MKSKTKKWNEADMKTSFCHALTQQGGGIIRLSSAYGRGVPDMYAWHPDIPYVFWIEGKTNLAGHIEEKPTALQDLMLKNLAKSPVVIPLMLHGCKDFDGRWRLQLGLRKVHPDHYRRHVPPRPTVWYNTKAEIDALALLHTAVSHLEDPGEKDYGDDWECDDDE